MKPDKGVLVAAMLFLAGVNVCYGSTESVPPSSAPYVEIKTGETAKTLSIYFSLGCFHCIKFLHRGMTWMKQKLEKKQLNIRFLELPRMMPYREGRMQQANKYSDLATRYTQCIAAEKGPDAYLYALNEIMLLARQHVRLNAPKRLKMDWSWFVYARNDQQRVH